MLNISYIRFSLKFSWLIYMINAIAYFSAVAEGSTGYFLVDTVSLLAANQSQSVFRRVSQAHSEFLTQPSSRHVTNRSGVK